MKRFTAGRVARTGMPELFDVRHRWQRWLDVEAALARAQAEQGIVPVEAAEAIRARCQVAQLDLDRVDREVERTSHPLMPLVVELSRVVGEPHGGWVHWGATTQNITQTGDVLLLKEAHTLLLWQVGAVLEACAGLAERGADMVMAGRTHGQHAVPITFGFKAAGWIDEFIRHVDRLRELESRLFVALLGGAAGTFASLGQQPEGLQASVARSLGLGVTDVPSRSSVDHLVESVSTLGLVAGTCGRFAREVYTLMRTEFAEAEEPIPEGVVGSSTMPQKRNPQLCQDVLGIASEVRGLVPVALEALQSEHEADHSPATVFEMQERACIAMAEVLERVRAIAAGLVLHPERMRANLDLTGGSISAEPVMLELGAYLGRQQAHEVVYGAAQEAFLAGSSFPEALMADERVRAHLSQGDLAGLLAPDTHTGRSGAMAGAAAERARKTANLLRNGE